MSTLNPTKEKENARPSSNPASTKPVKAATKTDPELARKQEERRLKLEQFRKEREQMKSRNIEARKPAVPPTTKPTSTTSSSTSSSLYAPTASSTAKLAAKILPSKPTSTTTAHPKPALGKPLASFKSTAALSNTASISTTPAKPVVPASTRKSPFPFNPPSLAAATAEVDRSLAPSSFDSPLVSASRTTYKAEDAGVPMSVKRLLPSQRDGAVGSTPVKSLAVQVGLNNFEERIKSAHKLQRKLEYSPSSPIPRTPPSSKTPAAHTPRTPTTTAAASQQLSPNHATTWIQKALDLEALGWFEGALACFRQGLERGAEPKHELQLEFEAFKLRLGMAEGEELLSPGDDTVQMEFEVAVKDAKDTEEMQGMDGMEEAMDELEEEVERLEKAIEGAVERIEEEQVEEQPDMQDEPWFNEPTQTFELSKSPTTPPAASLFDSPSLTTPREIQPKSPDSPTPPILTTNLDSPSNEEYFGAADASMARLSLGSDIGPGTPFQGLSPLQGASATTPRDKTRKGQVEDMVRILGAMSLTSPVKPEPVSPGPVKEDEEEEERPRERSATPRPGHANPLRTKAETMVPVGSLPKEGMMTVLTPVRARPRQQELLGVPSYVTPVRRSVRTMYDSETVKEEGEIQEAEKEKGKTPGGRLQMMLESVGYAYAPNEAVAVDPKLVRTLLRDGQGKMKHSPQ